MKAKKIMAIGLIAAMTLGMTTSVFATVDPYANVPQFDGWKEPLGPDTTVQYEEGKGWLEGSLEESCANVILPVTPYFPIEQGKPGLFDFGFDPQRLVQKTSGARYTETFTDAAKSNGVYFVNAPENEESYRNSYDNKSVKYTATNIGTKDVEIEVTATLTGGEGFTYFDHVPTAGQVMEKTATACLTDLYEDGAAGSQWKTYALENKIETNLYVFANVLVNGYDSLDPFEFTGDALTEISTLSSDTFATGDALTKSGAELLAYAVIETTNETNLKNLLNDYHLVNTPSEDDKDKIGMYMDLSVALGDDQTATIDPAKIKTDYLKPVVLESGTPSTSDATVTIKQIVHGNPANYKTVVDPVTKAYEFKMVGQTDREPFETASFWVSGAASKNDTVPSVGFTIPTFEYTWKFTIAEPEPEPVEPKLVTLNGDPYAGEAVFSAAMYGEEGVELGFNLGTYKEISDIQVQKSNGEYVSISSFTTPDTYYEVEYDTSIEEEKVALLTVKNTVFSDAVTLQKNRNWNVIFIDANSNEKVIPVVFIPGDD